MPVPCMFRTLSLNDLCIAQIFQAWVLKNLMIQSAFVVFYMRSYGAILIAISPARAGFQSVYASGFRPAPE